MKLPYLIFIIFLCYSCNHEQHFNQINQNTLTQPNQKFAFDIKYLGKDTLKTEGLSVVDSQHIYRLKSNNLDQNPDGWGNMGKTYNYYVDSTNDGGKTWSIPKLIWQNLKPKNSFKEESFIGFYASSNGNKYILSDEAVYSTHKDLSFKKYEYKTYPFANYIFNQANDELKYTNEDFTLSFDSINDFHNLTAIHIVNDTTNKEINLDNSHSNVLASCLTPDSDTLYTIYKQNENLVLEKFNYTTSTSDKIFILNNKLPLKKKLSLIVSHNNYKIFSSTISKSIKLDKPSDNPSSSTLYFSNDYGKTWDSSVVPIHDFYSVEANTKDNVLSFIDEGVLDQSTIYNILYCTIPNDTCLFSINNQSLLSDSIKQVMWHTYFPKIFITGIDSTQKWNYLFLLQLIPQNKLNQLLGYQINEYPDEIKIRCKVSNNNILDRRITFKLSGSSEYYYNQTHTRIPLANQFNPNIDSTVWETSFKPELLDLKSGDKYKLHLFFSDNTKATEIDLTNKYTPINFYQQNSSAINIATVVVSYFMILVLVLLISPLTIHKVYKRISISDLISSSPDIFKIPLSIVNIVLPFSFFVKSRRVLNAWTQKHSNILKEQFRELNTVENRAEGNYISLPLKLFSTVEQRSENISSPDSKFINQFVDGERKIIQIIGEGGVGKTTLAIQLCRWITSLKNNKVFRIPFVIDFETEDIIASIISKLKAWIPEEKLNKEFIEALLNKGNIVLLIDALSEQSLEMQKYINSIHSTVDCKILIITTRKSFRLQNLNSYQLQPLTLTPEKLLYFITTYIENKESGTKNQININAEQQIELATKIIKLLRDINGYSVVTPLLVKLIIESFFDDYNNSSYNTAFQKIPTNIPEVYYKYLEKTNPNNPKTDNFLSTENLFKISEVLAYLSLKNNFIPQDFIKEDAISFIINKYNELKSIDFIKRLVDNTILIEKTVLGTYYLRFNLDPIAEYLGAKYYYQQSKNNNKLESFTRETLLLSDDAKGFKTAYLAIKHFENAM